MTIKKNILSEWVYEDTLQEELVEESLKKVKAITQWDSLGGSKTSRKKDLQLLPEFGKITEKLNKIAEHLVADMHLECTRLTVSSMWATKISEGEHRQVHINPNAWASGILYLTYSKVNTEFISKNHWPTDNTLLIYRDIYDNYKSYQINPQPGKICVFPSTLMHGVGQSDEPFDRYSLSFNFLPSGEIGYPYENRSANLTVQ